MLFNSLTFALLCGLALGLYWATTQQRVRLMVLLITSVVFYSWFHWPSSFLLFATIGINFAFGLAQEQRRSRGLLALSIAINLASLSWFKYAGFFADSLVQLLAMAGVQTVAPGLPRYLPLGISFFTFQVIAYQVDVYRGEVKAERSLLVFAVFKSFFAQLIAGPIVRASEFLPQLRERRLFISERWHRGLFLVMSGLFLKSVVADTLAQFVQQAFTHTEQLATSAAWLGIYSFAFQLFADFWGYSTMAVGLGLLFGLELPMNFATPYLATNLQDFWRRWHITLSQWFRDYLYIPLGGGRKHPRRNLIITMTLAGLWHGAGINFILWGFLHGVWQAIERTFRVGKTSASRGVRVLQTLLLFHGVCLCWVLFKASTLQLALAYFSRLLLPPYTFDPHVPSLQAVLLISFAVLHPFLARLFVPAALNALSPRKEVLILCTMWLFVLAYGGATMDFIYFQF
jgi:alginate O-acetyltransferase complex protein AlgI